MTSYKGAVNLKAVPNVENEILKADYYWMMKKLQGEITILSEPQSKIQQIMKRGFYNKFILLLKEENDGTI